MTVWFVSRHRGAVAWAQRNGLTVDRWAQHLDPELIQPGDTVAGTLPVQLAARVCERGGLYLHLRLELPMEARGHELQADELEKFGARLEPYFVVRDASPKPSHSDAITRDDQLGGNEIENPGTSS
jgi:CRISPR-associated protein Csx16